MFSSPAKNTVNRATDQHNEIIKNREKMYGEGTLFEGNYQQLISDGVPHNEAVDVALSAVLNVFEKDGGRKVFNYNRKQSFYKTLDRTRKHQRGRLVYIGAYRAKTFQCKPILELQKIAVILEENGVVNAVPIINALRKTYGANYHTFKALIEYLYDIGESSLANQLDSEYTQCNKRGSY